MSEITAPAPTITVVIPTFNRVALLERCIRSIAAQRHSVSNAEIIVVNDGSRDGTREWMVSASTDLGFVPVNQVNRGPAAARNAGSAAAAGEIIVFVDDDVEVSEGFLAAHAEAHSRFPRCAVVGCLETIPGSDEPGVAELLGTVREAVTNEASAGQLLDARDLLTANCSLPRGILESVGGFDESLRANEDYELGLRLAADNVPIRYWPGAKAVERFVRSEDLLLTGAHDRGVAQGAISLRHPESSAAFNLSRFFEGSPAKQAARRIAWIAAPVALPFLRLARRLIGSNGSRYGTKEVLKLLSGFFYWAGVRVSVRSIATLRTIVDQRR